MSFPAIGVTTKLTMVLYVDARVSVVVLTPRSFVIGNKKIA